MPVTGATGADFVTTHEFQAGLACVCQNLPMIKSSMRQRRHYTDCKISFQSKWDHTCQIHISSVFPGVFVLEERAAQCPTS